MTTTTTTATPTRALSGRPVPLATLRRTWAANHVNATRPDPGAAEPPGPSTAVDTAAGRVVAVVGCPGTVGATTVAVALATVAGAARVVECCSFTASGLSAAGSAELGSDAGWLRSTRGIVGLERTADLHGAVVDLPTPLATATGRLTVLDVGWDLAQVLSTRCWLRTQVRAATRLVVVTAATGPGLHHLDTIAALLPSTPLTVAVIGPPVKKWPAPARAAMTPAVRRLLDRDRLIAVPHDPRLAAAGLTADPLPPPVLAAAHQLLTIISEGTPS